MLRTCPDSADLEKLSLGLIDGPAAEVLAEHLQSCSSCIDTLQSLAVNDELIDTLRGAPRLPVAEKEVARLLDRLGRERFSEATDILGEAPTSVSLGEPISSVRRGNTSATPPVAVEDAPALGSIREYRLLEKLGEGGMGAVYKAQHTKLRRTVALKVLPPGQMQSPAAVARFEREMQAVGALDHEHIVRAFDAGEHDGRHYLVMEFVAGRDLSQIVRDLGPLSLPDACEIIRQAAIGLQHAHEAGLVHRDIKPSNLMLSESGVVKILDLGLARLTQQTIDGRELTSTGQVMGTLDYMAPEQGGDTHHVDIRADIYSLGATLYKLLCGEAPFADAKYDTPVKKLMALATQLAPDVRTKRPDVPPGLAIIVARMLAKEPDDRYATPQEVATALAPLARGANLRQLARGENSGEIASATAPWSPPAAAKQASPAGRKWPPARVFVAAAAPGGIALLLLGIILYWNTPQGTVWIEINDPTITATFDSGGLTLKRRGDKPVRLTVDAKNQESVPSGERWLTIRRGDFEFQTRSFQLAKKGDTVLKIELLDGKVHVFANGKRIGERAVDQPAPVAADLDRQSGPWALKFEGKNDYVQTPVEYWGTGDVTLEAWVTPHELGTNLPLFTTGSVHLVIWKSKSPDFSWWFVVDGHDATGEDFHLAWFSGHPLRADEPVHVAAVRRSGKLAVFVNGRLSGSAAKWGDGKPPEGPSAVASGTWKVGRNPQSYTGSINATVREVRISSTARYDKDFTPQTRFTPDGDTLALYHCDEGAGDVLIDSSGNNHHGKIVGAKWVRTKRLAALPAAEVAPKIDAASPGFDPDSDTVALFHFDEGEGDELKDSSGNNHHGKIVGGTWVPLSGESR